MKKRKLIYGVIITVLVYPCTYILLDIFGVYQVVKAKPYDMLYEPEGKSYDVEMWCPSAAFYQDDYATDNESRQIRGNLLGFIFSPLIKLDRRYWHRTILIIDGPPGVKPGRL